MPYVDGKLTPADSDVQWAAQILKFIYSKSADKEITYGQVESILGHTLNTLKDHPMFGPNAENQPIICFTEK